MTTMTQPKQPKHGSRWARDKPTLGAVVLFLLLALGFGIAALVTGFDKAASSRRMERDERCNGQIQVDDLNRRRALSDLNERDKAAVNRWIHRVSQDVLDGTPEDIPAAYEAYRADVE